MAKKPEQPEYEPIVDKLRALIDIIESDQGNIEDSLKAYEEGIGLIRQAQSYLSEAEQRVNLLSQDLAPEGQAADE